MDNLKMHTSDLAEENYKKLAELFPDAVTETKNENGDVVRAIDADVLQQEISAEVVKGQQERYQFNWPGKKESIAFSNRPITNTLRLDRKKSVGRDGMTGSIDTENVYIEGDNLETLKILHETYLGLVKVIYIDPPYNTGNDFIYNDYFTKSVKEYSEISGEYDEEKNRMVQNTSNNGRFHTDWLNMIYPRLRIAKDLLSNDGVIFISIGQNELSNLLNVCNEIFGEHNQVGLISRMMKSGGNKGQYFSPNMEYILVYAKNIYKLGYFREPLSDDTLKSYNHVEQGGERDGESFSIKGLCQPGLGIRPNQRFWIEAPDGTFLIPQGKNFPSLIKEGEKVTPTDEDTCWKWTYQRYAEEKEKGNIYFSKNSSATALVNEKGEIAKWNVFNKIWLSDRQTEGRVPVDLITKWENRTSSEELKALDIPFDFAKPSELIKYIVSLVDNTSDSIIMDFFSGSATTAQAVMKLNSEDLGHRKFIMVQFPEICDEKTEAYKAGYKNICEIGEERIRRAGEKIKEGFPLTKNDLDIGFRVFHVNDSNMKDVYYYPDDYNQEQIELFTDNIKPDRTPEDLLFQVMLDLGILLSSKIEETEIAGKKVFSVANGYLIACFDSNITEGIVTEIAKQHPFYAVFRDSGIANDSVMTNFEQIFETYSPKTQRKVI